MIERRSDPVTMLVVDGARATAFAQERESGQISGCIYDATGSRVELSLRLSGVGGDRVTNFNPDRLPEDFEVKKSVEDDAIYLGHYMGQYGHFLMETISTFWALKYSRGHLPVFHPFIFGTSRPSFATEMLELFSIPQERIVWLSENVRFRRLLVPQRTFGLNSFVHDLYMQPISFVKEKAGDYRSNQSPVFFSRARLKNDPRGFRNAQEVDRMMRDLGISVVYPEELSVIEQVRVCLGCSALIGFSGSALHNAVFLKKGARVIEIADWRSPGKPLQTQVLCSMASQTELLHIPLKSGHDPAIYDIQYLRSKLNDLSLVN